MKTSERPPISPTYAGREQGQGSLSAGAGTGMRERIDHHDWSSSLLGKRSTWPPGLKVMVDLILDSSLPMMLLWSDHLVQIYNDAYASIMVDRSPILGQAWNDFRPRMGSLDRLTFSRVLHGQTLTFGDGTHPIMRPAMPPFPSLRTCYSPARDEDGDVAGILISVVPRDELASVGGSSVPPDEPVATFECSLLSGLLAMSPNATDVLGLEHAGTIWHIADHDRLIHPDDLERYHRQIERAVATGEAFQVEYRIIRPCDGKVSWLRIQGIALHDPGLPAIGLMGAIWAAGTPPPDGARPVREHQDLVLARVPGQVRSVLDDALEAAIEVQHADAGTIHLYRASDMILQVIALAGFEQDIRTGKLEAPLANRDLICVRAFVTRNCLVADDREPSREPWSDQELASLLPARAVCAIPLLDGTGRAIGVLTTYFRKPRRPSRHDRRRIDHCATWAVNAIKATTLARQGAQTARHLSSLLEALPHLVWQSRPGGDWSVVSPGWSAYTGLSEEQSKGSGWLEAVHPDDRARTITAWKIALLGTSFDLSFRLWHASEQDHRWFLTRANPVRDEQGGVVAWIGTSTDVDPFHQAKARQDIVLRELQHQVRNTLAVIRSIARRTAESSANLQEYTQHLEGRIGAFARVQAAAARAPGSGIELESLIAEELFAYHAEQDGQARIAGPRIRLQSKTAEIFGLAVHELATNALKHGALAGPAGRIHVVWRIDGDRLVFEWTESGVAYASDQAIQEGFGMTLLKRTLAYELKAAVVMHAAPAGMSWTIVIPINERTIVEEAPGRNVDPR